jgi:hypothetical protein
MDDVVEQLEAECRGIECGDVHSSLTRATCRDRALRDRASRGQRRDQIRYGLRADPWNTPRDNHDGDTERRPRPTKSH